MHEVNISRLNLNLLKVFSALIEEGSATAAGERLSLAQSTVSHSLARLREAFGDPLFVRSVHGLNPTPLALGLREPVARALRALQEAIDQHQVFDPSSSTRTFRLLLTDVGEMLFVPPLIARIRAVAPRIRLAVQQLSRQDYKEALESRDVDLAIGQLPRGQTDLVQQFLSAEPFDGYARLGHPILENPTMEAFLGADHLVVGRPGVSETHVQKALGPRAARRRVVLELCHFIPAAFVLSQTDLIGVFPRTLSKFLDSFGTLARFPPPLKIEPIALRQFWHANSTHDAGCKWLRRQVVALFQRRSG